MEPPAPSGYTVTVSLTNPLNATYFYKCDVYEQPTSAQDDESSVQIGSIDGPDASAVFTVSQLYLEILIEGLSIDGGEVSCTGGVSLVSAVSGVWIVMVESSGTVTIDGIDYDS